jgi:hypothetical protein
MAFAETPRAKAKHDVESRVRFNRRIPVLRDPLGLTCLLENSDITEHSVVPGHILGNGVSRYAVETTDGIIGGGKGLKDPSHSHKFQKDLRFG